MIRIVARLNPLESSVVTCEVEQGLSIAQIVDTSSDRIYVTVDDIAIPRAEWPNTFPKDGELVVIVVAPQGIEALLAAIATMAMKVGAAAASLATAAGVSGGTAGTIGAVVATVTYFGTIAGMLYSAIAPFVIKPQLPSATSGSGDRFYSLTQGSNQSSPYGVIPRLYGDFRIIPPLAGNYYTKIGDTGSAKTGKQYLHVLLCLGYGPLKIGNRIVGTGHSELIESSDTAVLNLGEAGLIRVGNTPIEELQGFRWQIGTARAVLNPAAYGSSLQERIYVSDIEETQLSIAMPFTIDLSQPHASNNWDSEGSINNPPAAYVATSNQNPASIDIDLSFTSMYGMSEDGAPVATAVRFRVRYKRTGTTNWQNGFGSSNLWEVGPTYIKQPLSRSKTIQILSATGTDYMGAVPAGTTYDVEITRTATLLPAHIKDIFSDATWTAIRSNKTTPAWNLSESFGLEDVILMAVRVKATGQLSGSLDPVSIRAQSVLPVWTGASFVEQPTSNPAWIYADILRGKQLQAPSRVSTEQIDWDSLKDWADWCDGDGVADPAQRKVFAYSWYHSEEETLLDRLRAVSSTGRAAWALSDARFSVIRDNNFYPVQLISARNSRNFEFTKNYPKVPHALRVRWVNEQTWQQDELLVLDDDYYQEVGSGVFLDALNQEITASDIQTRGLRAPDIYETLETQGVTKKVQAFREGRYYLAALRLRREVYKVDMDFENLVAQRGDCVRLSHDVLLNGRATGRIKQTTLLSGGVQLILDETVDLTPESGVTYCLRIRKSDGSIVLADLAGGLGETNQVTITNSGLGVQPGDLFVFGPKGSETVLVKITQIDYNPDMSATITMVPAAPGVLTADEGTIEEGEGGPDVPPELRNPPVPNFTGLTSDQNDLELTVDGVRAKVKVAWAIPASAVRVDQVIVTYDYDGIEETSDRVNAGSGYYAITGIPPETLVSVYLRSFNETSGKFSAATAVRTVLTGTPAIVGTAPPTELDLAPSSYVTSDGVVHYEIRASWLQSGTVSAFEIQWQILNAVDSNWQGVTLPATTPQFTIKDLLPETYTVRVRNTSGIFNTPSDWLEGEVVVNIKDVAPNPPTNLVSTSTNSGVELTWTNPLDPDLAYIEIWESIYNNRATATDIAQVFASQFFRPVSDTAFRYYWLRAVDTSGNVSAWAPSDAMAGLSGRALGIIGDNQPPPAPASLTLTPDTWQVRLDWTQPTEIVDLVGTEIWFSKTNNRASATKAVLTKENFYTQLNLESDTTYYYWIRNFDVEGYFSEWYPSSPTGGQAVTVGKDPSDYIDLLGDLVFLVVPHPGKYVDTSTGEIIGDAAGSNPNAVWYPEGVYIRNAMIKDGSLEGVKIKASSITSDKIDTRGLDIRDAQGNIILSAGVGLDITRIANAGAFASLNRLLSDNIDLYIEDGAISNAYIGDVIQSADYLPGQQGWKINKQGNIEVYNLSARGSVQSTVFIPGQQGWKINENGTAEFNNATIRGTIAAGTVIAGTDYTLNDLTSSVFDAAIEIAASGYYFAFDENNVCKSQQTLYFYANNATNPAWQAVAYGPTGAGVTLTLGTDAQGNRTLNASQMTAGSVRYERVEITATAGSVSDTLTIARLKDGDSALVGWLTNESANLAADPAGSVISYSTASGNFRVFQGATEVTGSCSFSVVSSVGMTVSISTAGAYSASNMTADNASAELRATYNGVTLSKIFNVSKARAGSPGSQGISPLSISASSLAFLFNSTGTVVGSSNISLFVSGDNASSANWTAIPYDSAGVAGSAIVLGGTGANRQLTATQFGNYSRVEITATSGSLSDSITILRLTQGGSALSGYLTNETAVLSADASGTVSSFAPAAGSFIVLYGLADVTTGCTFSVVSATGATAAISAAGAYSISAMSADTAIVTLKAIHTETGTQITKVFEVAKAKTGEAPLSLQASAQAFVFKEDGTLRSGATIALTAFGAGASSATWSAIPYTAAGSAGTAITLGGSGQSRTLTSTQFAANDRVEITLSSGGVTDKMTVVRLTDGASAVAGYLTNEASVLSATADGTVASWSAANGQFKVFHGAVEVTNSCVFAVLSSPAPTVQVTIGATGAYSVSGITGEQGTASLTATYQGATLTKVLSVSKARTGVSPPALTASSFVFAFDKAGTLKSSGTITFTLAGDGNTAAIWAANGFSAGSTTGVAITLGGTAGTNQRTLTSAQFGSYARVEISATVGSLSDKVTILRVVDGVDSVVGYLTESNASVAATADGTISSGAWTTASGFFKVYSGITDVTASSSFAVVTGSATGGLVASIDSVTIPGKYSASALTSDVGTITFRATYNGVAIDQVFTVSRVRPGASTTILDLSNENVSVPAAVDGTVISGGFSSAVTTASVYLGAADDSSNWSFTITPGAGVTGTASNLNRTYAVTGLSTDSGYVDFTASRSGYASLTGRFTLSKAKAGTEGQSAVIYEVEPTVGSVGRSVAGVYNPATVTFSAYSKTGTADRVAYTGRFIIDTQSTVGGAWATSGTGYSASTADESSRAFTIPSGVVSIRARLYKAGGTTVLVDQETIPVVSDGATGAPGVNGTRTAVLDMYIWASSIPTTFPSGSSTYTWATGQFTSPTTPNGWTLTPGSGAAGQTLWSVTQVYADSGTAAATSIAWTSATARASGGVGANGANGARTAYLELYRWSSTTPTSFPSGSSTYTWATGEFTLPATPNSWSLVPGAATAGQTLWACSVRFTDTGTSATSSITWNTGTAYAVGAAGATGATGPTGLAGERGSKAFIFSGTYSDASWASVDSLIIGGSGQAQGSLGVVVNGDVVTLVNPSTSYSKMRFRQSGSWVDIASYINGNMLVNGTITAEKIDSRGLSIKDANGSVVFAAGTQVPSDLVRAFRNVVQNVKTWSLYTGAWIYENMYFSGDRLGLILPSNGVSNWVLGASPNMNLWSGTWTVSFDAEISGSVPRSLHVDLSPDTLPETIFTISGGLKRYSATWTSTHSDMGNCQLRFFAWGANSGQINIGNIKLEAGSTATPWCPNSIDKVGSDNLITSGNISTYIADAAITNAKIDSLDAGKVSFGSMSGDRIDANTLHANRIVSGSIGKVTEIASSWSKSFGGSGIKTASITDDGLYYYYWFMNPPGTLVSLQMIFNMDVAVYQTEVRTAFNGVTDWWYAYYKGGSQIGSRSLTNAKAWQVYVPASQNALMLLYCAANFPVGGGYFQNPNWVITEAKI